jgi:rubrerythrin
MNAYDASEQAYKRGYEQGKKDARKKGRWIHDQVEACNPFVDSLPVWVDVMQCSVCNEYIEGSHGKNYCPNCGADMRGEEDG